MPEHWLTEAETSRFTDYPAEISEIDLIPFFTLTDGDRKLITKLHHNPNRLGFALQLCTLRYLGFVPNDLQRAPAPVIKFLARQLDVSPDAIDSYGERAQTRTNHLTEIEERLGFHKTSAAEKKEIGHWLRERALEQTVPCSYCNCSVKGCTSRRSSAQGSRYWNGPSPTRDSKRMP